MSDEKDRKQHAYELRHQNDPAAVKALDAASQGIDDAAGTMAKSTGYGLGTPSVLPQMVATDPTTKPYVQRVQQAYQQSPAAQGANPINQAKNLGKALPAVQAVGGAMSGPLGGLAAGAGSALVNGVRSLYSPASEPNQSIERNPIEDTLVGQGKREAFVGSAPGAGGPPAPGPPPYDPLKDPKLQPYHVGAQNVDLVDPRTQALDAGAAEQEVKGVDQEMAGAERLQEEKAKTAEVRGDGLAKVGSAKAEKQFAEAHIADERAQKLDDLRRARDDFSKQTLAQSKADPNRWWNNQNTGKKVGWGIATVLSGFGSGLLHQGGNSVLDMIKDHVHEEIDAQRQDYQHGRDRLDDMNNLYAQAFHAFGDHDAAYLAAMDTGLGAVQDQVDAEVARRGSPEALARGQQLKGQLQQKRAQVQEEWVQRVKKDNKYVPAHTVDPLAQYKAGMGLGASYGKNSDAEHIADRRQREMLPRLQEIQRKKLEIEARNGGHIPGSGLLARTAYNLLPEKLVNNFAGTDAALYRGLEGEEAEALNKLSGQRGIEMFDKTKNIIQGPGTEEYRRGMADHFRGVTQATEQNMYNGYPIEESRNVRTTRPMQPTDFSPIPNGRQGLANARARQEADDIEGFEE